MKKILIALAMIGITYSGAEAQTKGSVSKKDEKCIPVAKKAKAKVVKQKSTVLVARAPKVLTAQATSCRLVPYQVCTILPDRRSVSCYNTMDLEELNPADRETTYYGPVGPMPGQPEKFDVETVVVKGNAKREYCKRAKDGNGTLCYQSGSLIRDEFGYYSYR